MKHNLLLLIALGLVACSSNERIYSEVKSFGKYEELEATVKKTPVSALVPRGMFTMADKLFLYKERDSVLFDVFKLPDCDYYCSAGKRGEGPNDFLFLDPRSFHTTENGFKVIESGTHLLKTVELRQKELIVATVDKAVVGRAAINGFFSLSDGRYLSYGNIGDANEFVIIDSNSGTCSKFGSYPEWVVMDVNQNHERFVTFLKNCVPHPTGEKFAVFYVRFKRLRIYDSSGVLLRDVNVTIDPYHIGVEEDFNNRFIYYVGQPQAIGDYIYAVCANRKERDVEGAGLCELQVWDWQGNAIARYKLDRNISFFSISEKFNKMFAMNNVVDNEIYMYDLPAIKE